MAGEYDGSEPIRSTGGVLVPQVWDETLNGGAGGFRVTTPADLGGSPPLSAPSSNIPRTSVSASVAAAVASGACTYGFYLENDSDSAGDLYYGAAGVDATRGGRLEPGERVWLPYLDSGAVYVLASAAGTYYRGVRN
jgi:hypothetical protein